MSSADLAAHTSSWVEPIGTSYRGYDVWEIPPNGQGLAALIALNILEGYDLARFGRDSAQAYHLELEAMKLAFADAHRYIADPEKSTSRRSGCCRRVTPPNGARSSTSARDRASRAIRLGVARSTFARPTATA